MTGHPVKSSRQSRLSGWLEQLGRLGHLSKAVVLCVTLCVILLPSAAIGYMASGSTGVLAATIAFAVCLAAGLNGLAISALFRRSESPFAALSGMLVGMLVRMGMPLLLILALVIKSHPLLDGGFVYYLITFYQVMLFVELMLVTPHASRGEIIELENGMQRHGG
jgi:Na+/proline symporter